MGIKLYDVLQKYLKRTIKQIKLKMLFIAGYVEKIQKSLRAYQAIDDALFDELASDFPSMSRA